MPVTYVITPTRQSTSGAPAASVAATYTMPAPANIRATRLQPDRFGVTSQTPVWLRGRSGVRAVAVEPPSAQPTGQPGSGRAWPGSRRLPFPPSCYQHHAGQSGVEDEQERRRRRGELLHARRQYEHDPELCDRQAPEQRTVRRNGPDNGRRCGDVP